MGRCRREFFPRTLSFHCSGLGVKNRLMNRALLILISCFGLFSCKPGAPAGPLTGQKMVRYVMLKNQSGQTLAYDLSINGGESERIQLPTGHGLFLYELLPNHAAYAKLPPTEVSMASPDGVKLTFNSFACELESALNSKGDVTAKGQSEAESQQPIPDAEYLDKRNLSAQQVPKFRRFDVRIVPSK